MQYARLGASGLSVSRIALGMMTFGTPAWRPWVLDEAAARPIVRRAFELGINVFDTADMYSAGLSEEITGRLLREMAPRDEVVIATKLFYPVDLAFKGGNDPGPKPAHRPNASGLSRKRVFAAADASLKRLGADYIDLYQIHRYDPATPVEETMEALNDLVRAGKVRYIGASSMWAWQFAKMQHAAERHGWTRFVSMQNHYNLAYREEEREMVPLCRDQGVGLLPWSPLARGFLAGNRARDDRSAGATARARTDDIALKLYYSDADFAVQDAVRALAPKRGVSNATLAYAWLLSRPGVTAPIVGASQVWQLEEAVKALDLTLSSEECAGLEAPYRPHPVLGHS
ncbi:MAG TPA: aldo/keto reductase [Burkholderiaceae bacterium]|nr:aldo/keto reductase [Burkholderiaceae bacterium]HQR69267.1 aldo/keto reductase [Burkholderiaceae bacterium]